MTGIDIVHVPYKDAGPAIIDLIAGQVSMIFDNIPSAMPHIKSGKLRAIATTGSKRAASLPDVPTVTESGVPGYQTGGWYSLVAPAGTPKEIIAILNAAAVRGVRSQEFSKRMSELGFDVIGSTPEEMAEMIKVELARWGPVVKASGARAD